MQFPLGFKLPDSVMEDYGQLFLRTMMSKDDQTGAVTVPTEVSQDETFYTTRRDYGLMVNGIDRLGHHDIEQHQVRPASGRQFAGPSRRLAQG